MTERIDVVVPVHNEGESIEATLREFHDQVVLKDLIAIRFVVCEDGSSDNTVEVLKKLARDLPIHLITSSERKGYSRAVIDGFKASTSEVVGFIDSDGQCDPKDFKQLYEQISSVDFVVGYRNPRSDHWVRLLMSKAFGVVYRCLFGMLVRDPSCPYLLVRRSTLEQVLQGNVGILKQGFWWEFLARVSSLRISVTEVPVRHRTRASGKTQVYRPMKVPGIAWQHLVGLFKLKKELDARPR